jgi:hypothetical protein
MQAGEFGAALLLISIAMAIYFWSDAVKWKAIFAWRQIARTRFLPRIAVCRSLKPSRQREFGMTRNINVWVTGDDPHLMDL